MGPGILEENGDGWGELAMEANYSSLLLPKRQILTSKESSEAGDRCAALEVRS
jgi:hypothetical protein